MLSRKRLKLVVDIALCTVLVKTIANLLLVAASTALLAISLAMAGEACTPSPPPGASSLSPSSRACTAMPCGPS